MIFVELIKPFFISYLLLTFAVETCQAAFYASGNGGQTIMFIPDLDKVIAITNGNYSTNPE